MMDGQMEHLSRISPHIYGEPRHATSCPEMTYKGLTFLLCHQRLSSCRVAGISWFLLVPPLFSILFSIPWANLLSMRKTKPIAYLVAIAAAVETLEQKEN
jgi:hypothetical protein